MYGHSHIGFKRVAAVEVAKPEDSDNAWKVGYPI
jgi:hypothetical protein